MLCIVSYRLYDRDCRRCEKKPSQREGKNPPHLLLNSSKFFRRKIALSDIFSADGKVEFTYHVLGSTRYTYVCNLSLFRRDERVHTSLQRGPPHTSVAKNMMMGKCMTDFVPFLETHIQTMIL